MATARPRKPTEDAPPPTAPRKRRAKANGHEGLDDETSGVPQTEPEATALDVPEEDSDFWNFLMGRSPDQWQFLICYLWRVEPITDRRTGGKPTSIAKYARPFDMDTVLKEHGSGVYRVDVCQVFPAGGSKRIRQHFFTLLNIDYPPKVPFGDWVEDPANSFWKWAGPKLQAAQAPIQPGGAVNPEGVVTAILHGIRELRGDKDDNTSTAALILSQAEKHTETMMALMDPQKQLTTLKSLLAQLAPPAPDTSATTMMFEMMREELRESRKEIRDMRANQGQQKNPLEWIVENIPVIERLTEKFAGRVTRNHGTDWGAVATQALEKIGDNLPGIISIFQPRPGQTNGNAMMPRPAIAPPSPGPTARPSDAGSSPTGDAHTPSTASPEPTAPAEFNDARIKEIMESWGVMFQSIAPSMVNDFQRNKTGWEFRDFVLDEYGKLNWRTFKKDVGLEDLFKLIQVHPVLKNVMQPPAKLHLFLSEFFTEPGDEPPGTVIPDPEDDEDEPTKPAVKAGA